MHFIRKFSRNDRNSQNFVVILYSSSGNTAIYAPALASLLLYNTKRKLKRAPTLVCLINVQDLINVQGGKWAQIK